MRLKPTEANLLRDAFRLWLDDDLYNGQFDRQHRAAFAAIERASFGELPGGWNGLQRAHYFTLRWERFTAIADGAARRWTTAHRAQAPTRSAAWPVASRRPALAGGRRAEIRPRVFANTATAVELASVPGIGPAVARRILATRTKLGTLNSIDDLISVEGFAKDARATAATYLDFTIPPAPIALTSQELERLGTRPSFPDFIRYQLRTGLRHGFDPPGWPSLASAQSTPSGLAARQLALVAAGAVSDPFWAPRRRADVPDLKRSTQAALRADGIRGQRLATDVEGVGVVRNATYLDLVLELTDSARERIWVEVFFFTSAGDGPGARMLEALTRANERDVDVRLIVDTDLAADVHGASRINDATLTQLRAANVPFRLDAIGTTSHGKTLVVDGDRLLTGSHNWTTHAMYELDETSLYLESPTLATQAAERFTNLWHAYDPDPRGRSVDIALLRFLRPHERRTLIAAGLADSRTLLAAASTARGARSLATRHRLDPDRIERLWSLQSLIHELMLPEPTAWALAEAGFLTPASVRRASRKQLREGLARVGPLSDPYTGAAVRIDAVETARV